MGPYGCCPQDCCASDLTSFLDLPFPASRFLLSSQPSCPLPHPVREHTEARHPAVTARTLLADRNTRRRAGRGQPDRHRLGHQQYAAQADAMCADWAPTSFWPLSHGHLPRVDDTEVGPGYLRRDLGRPVVRDAGSQRDRNPAPKEG
ncbi:hypothetical protein PG994_015129 [Apiospora phragmitis]|uniref:Uncharacterized protein n=1 Tax=Apiospora phragmitis TaxID=2905665 RepID=A0ABR1SVX4_9PEZI